MKKIFAIIATLILSASLVAQSPYKMSYQCVVRNVSGVLVTNQIIGIRISVLQGTATGTTIYTEAQLPTTNANGLISIEIGGGIGFDETRWANGPYFLKTEIDPIGGTNYTILGTSQMLSVPYAFHASTANNIILFNDGRISDLFIKDDGTLMALVKISIEQPSSEVPTVADIDGNTYGTVKIGTQIWMTENLKTTKFNDNTAIPLVSDNSVWITMTTPSMCWYENDATTNKDTYGALYNWFSVSTNKLCPVGWHVPSKSEWEALVTYLGSLAGGRLRETGTTHWIWNQNSLNDSKFSALPSGSRVYDGTYLGKGTSCKWWSSTDNTILLRPYFAGFSYYDDGVVTDQYDSYFIGSSVRCIKD